MKSFFCIFNKQASSYIEFFKWLAVIFMVIDHTAIIFFENNLVMRDLGRLALPLFAYLLIHNYLYFTRSKEAFIKRIWLFAALSQPIYVLALVNKLNIFVLFAFVLSYIYIEEFLREKKPTDNVYMLFFLHLLNFIVFLMLSRFTGYGYFGFLFMIGLWLTFKESNNYLLLFFGILFLNISAGHESYVYFSFVPFVLLYLGLYFPVRQRRMPKMFFYVFYPAHLIFFKSIKFFL